MLIPLLKLDVNASLWQGVHVHGINLKLWLKSWPRKYLVLVQHIDQKSLDCNQTKPHSNAVVWSKPKLEMK